jgi:hypothetical protein
MKFRKKPVEVEAMQWTGNNSFSIMSFVGQQLEWTEPPHGMELDNDHIPPEAYTIIIPTLEGDMKASKGDWIVKGVKGEFYPCKPDVFEMTYEPSA